MNVKGGQSINANLWREVEKAFDAVVGLPPGERERALDTICSGGDQRLRSLVLDLLEADGQVGDFLEEPLPDDQHGRVFRALANRPLRGGPTQQLDHERQDVSSRAVDEGGSTVVEGVQDLQPGDMIGDRYRIDAILGEGGMGTVYRATQIVPIERAVAIKVIKLGMDTRRVIARFEIERQALAVMTHPNIARILDAGATERGRPFFVMELVTGDPITTYCDQRGLGVEPRLRLFVDVCEAVQHAHRKSVIHRDLKPSNVLVTEQDGRPLVKVIDFGIAKATGESAARHALSTEMGMFVGTPAYMSPEQLDFGGEVDTRTDVYALGLVLYELLTGSPAFDTDKLRRAGWVELNRVIREVDPERPSTRVGRRAASGQRPSPALRRRLRGDLDWIVMKALAKDPELRYETPSAFALDIQRHFDNQPVRAGPPSTAYVLGKFARRKKRLLAAVCAFALLGVVAVVAMYFKSQEALAARDEAARQLRISNVERGRLLGRTGDVGAAEELIWREFLLAPDSPDAYWALWEAFMRSGCVATVAGHAGRADEIDLDASGTLFATSGDDGRVVVRDAASMRVIADLAGPDAEMRALALRDDGRVVAAGGASGVITVWDVATQTTIESWQASDRELLAMDFSPDGLRLVAGGADGVVRLWDAGTAQLLADYDQGADRVQSLRFSPDGSLIAAGHVDVISVWDGASSHALRVFPARDEVHAVAFSHDGRLLAGGGQEQRIDVWELRSGDRVAGFEGINSTVRTLVFDLDDRSLFSGCWYSIDRWDLATGKRLWAVPTSSHVWGIVLDPRGHVLTAALTEGELRRWEVGRGGAVHQSADEVMSRTAVFGPGGDSVLSGDDSGRIQIADLATGDVRTTIDGHEGRVWSLDPSADGARVASAAGDGTILVRDLASGEVICTFDDGQIQTSHAIDLDDSGRLLAYAATGSRFKVREIPSGRGVELVTPTGAQSLSVAFSPIGGSLATIARDNNVRFWTTEGEPLGAVEIGVGEGGLWTMDYSADGEWLALGMWDRSIRIVNVARRTTTAVLEGHGGTVWAAAFKPDDPRILASAAADGTVRLWEIQNRHNLATIEVAPGRDVHSVSFTPDGSTLLAAGEFDSPVWYDLTHFDRHIAGNLEYQMTRFGDELGDERVRELRAWAENVLQRPWPRFSSSDRAESP